jgi:hypothetical protein
MEYHRELAMICGTWRWYAEYARDSAQTVEVRRYEAGKGRGEYVRFNPAL